MLPPKTNMYSDEPDAPAAASGGGDDAQESGKEALLPKSIFGDGVKPGDKITLTAVSVQENEVVCEKDGGDEPSEDDENREPEPEPGESGEGEAEPDDGDNGGMSSMLSD